MSHTFRRTKFREKDQSVIELQKEIEKIELQEAIEEVYDYDDDEQYDLTEHQLMSDSYNPRG